jgi:type IV secretion system protein VirB2
MKVQKTVLMMGVLVVLLLPELAYAQAGPGTGTLQNILNWLTGGFGRSCALIAIAAVGFGWLKGRIQFEPAIAVVSGIVVIFGGASIFALASAG